MGGFGNIEIPKSSKEFKDRFSLGGISEKEKAILSKEQLKNLNETGILEGEFVYDKNGNPISFISIDDVDFSEIDIDFINSLELPTTQEMFKNIFGEILKK